MASRRLRHVIGCLAPALVALALWSPTEAAGGAMVQKFFPLCSGDNKTFSGELTCTSGSVTMTMTVKSTTYNGQSAFEMRIQASGGTGTTDQRKYFRIVGDDVLYLGATFSGGGSSLSVTFNPAIRILSESGLASGGVSSGNTTAAVSGNAIPSGNYPVEYSYTTSFGGPLNVAACAYSDSRSVSGSFTLTDPNDPDVSEELPEFLYLAPEVGIAKIRIYAQNQFGAFIPCGWAGLTGGQVCGHSVCPGFGNLCVIVQPSEAATAGGQWRLAGAATWHNSGECETNLLSGQYTVEFKGITNWTAPASKTVTISNNQTTQTDGTYTRQTGSLRVVIQPTDVVTAGAQWRRVGSSNWWNSGQTETGIPTGQYAVECKTVAGWNAQTPSLVTIVNGQTAQATCTYARQAGSLRVQLEPSDVVTAGAQWRRVATTSWRNSGGTETNIPTGQYTVEFKPVAGWNTAPTQTVTIVNGQLTQTTGTYTAQTGSLQVLILPPEVLSAGAQWRRLGTSNWWNSGQTETGIRVGQYQVEFKPVATWTTPAVIPVAVGNNLTTTTNGTYCQPPAFTTLPQDRTVTQGGTVQFTVGATGASPLGYQWSRNGGPLADNGTNVIGSRSNVLNVINVTTNDSGDQFSVTVSNAGGSTSSPPATLTVVLGPQAPVILAEPGDQRVPRGAAVCFNSSIYGYPEPSLQWWFSADSNPSNGVPVGIADQDSLCLTNVGTNQAGWYWVAATNSEGTTNTRMAKLTVVLPPQIVAPPASLFVAQGDGARFEVSATDTVPLHYQWYFQNSALAGETSPAFVRAAAQTNQAGNYSVTITNEAGSTSSVATLMVLVPPRNQTVCGGENVTLAVAAFGPEAVTYQWRKDGSPLDGRISSDLPLASVSVTDEGNYDVIATSSAGVITSAVARVTVSPQPVITQQPPDQAATPGSIVQFNVVATGGAPFTYQWKQGGRDLVGETNAMLVLANAQTNSAGTYSVRVCNSCGCTDSRVATLLIVNRSLRMVSTNAAPGQEIALPLELVGDGTENRAHFNLTFNQTVLGLSDVVLDGSATNAALTWSNLPSGEVEIEVALPTNEVFTAGANTLAMLNLTVANAISNTTVAQIAFGSVAQITDPSGANLPFTPIGGTVTIPGVETAQVNLASGLFEQTLTVVSPPGGMPAGAALLVLVYDLGNDSRGRPMQIYNQTGVTNGIPYLLLNGPLAGNAALQIPLQFIVLDRQTVPQPRFVVAQVAGVLPPNPTGTPVPIDAANTHFVDGVFYLQFLTASGRTYYVQFKDSTESAEWKTAWPPITGTGGWVLWLDNGPPKTENLPGAARFYRALLVQ